LEHSEQLNATVRQRDARWRILQAEETARACTGLITTRLEYSRRGVRFSSHLIDQKEVIMIKKTLLVCAAITLMALPASAHCGSCGTGGDHSHAAKEASSDIVAVASSAGSFNTLLAAAKAAGLVDTLQSDGPFTVFAPTDDAFAKLPDGTVESLLANPDKLKQILLYHVVPGKVTAAEVVKLSKATSAQGSDIEIAVNGGSVKVDNANVIKTDVMASNGVIHVIDAVILPSS
jgi:uncharacterized surface protein with fasciclin (FAS1) repeats